MTANEALFNQAERRSLEPDEPPDISTNMVCGECQEPIYEGEKFANIDGKFYCENCLCWEMPREKLLDLVGLKISWEVA